MPKIYSIKDNLANTFSDPFVSANDQTATRLFSQTVNDPKTIISICPKDYVLYSLGSFTSDTGLIESDIDLISTADSLVAAATDSDQSLKK